MLESRRDAWTRALFKPNGNSRHRLNRLSSQDTARHYLKHFADVIRV
jgi:hypothetical protein